ncbi:MFS transporter [Limnohabitans sp. Bal53]|uniref:MFS transporter n=1 Tax=Limnohabitans sp. Bal53 TaxID=1977910 RepID=UPI000D3C8029|nr:MFS transporter [Limnohabitans sp. Bal53]PUE41660.1 MFS transporter [Limnohabitans sp. Bal53]
MNPDLARLIAGQMFLHACMAGARMATPLLALQQGFSAVAVGALLALFALAPMFLALPAGRYSDRKGLQKIMRISVVMSASGVLLSALWPIFPVMCVSALAAGGATGMAVIALQRHVGRMAKNPAELKVAFSWLSLGPAVSNFVGPVLAGLLIDFSGPEAGHVSGYQWAFFLLAVFPLFTWFWVLKVPELPLSPDLPNAHPRRALDLLAEPMMRRLLGVNWLLSSCWDVHTFVVPVLGHERGYSASVVGSILGAFALAAAFIRVCLPFIARHVKEHQIITSAMVCTALLFAIYPLMPSAAAMGVCSVLLGLVLGTVQPMIMSTLHQITPPHRQGEALGLRLMSINASSVLMPMLFGSLGAVVGVAPLFWVVGAAVGSGARGAWHLRPSPVPKDHDTLS